MAVIVRSLGFDILDYIDDFVSVRQELKYYGISRTVLTVPFNKKYADLFNLGKSLTGSINPRMIHLEGEEQDCYMVTDIRVVNDGKSRVMEVGCYSMLYILNFRVLRNDIEATDLDIGMLARNITSNAIGDDSFPERSFGRVINSIRPNLGYIGSLSLKIGDKVADSLIDFFSEYEYSVRIVPRYSEDTFALEEYIGTDRTYTSNNPKIFSDEAENVSNISFEQDSNNFSNVALMNVYNESDNPTFNYNEIQFVSIGDVTYRGWSRREFFGNGRDITNKYKPIYNEDEIELPFSAHAARVRRDGILQLAEMKEVNNMSATLAPEEKFMFNKDFFLGDRVTMVMNEVGVVSNERITSVTRVIDKNGENVTISIGAKDVSFIKSIRKGLRNIGINK